MDYTVHRILQTRTLEWVALSFSRGSSQSRDQIQVSCIAGRFFISWATSKAIITLDHTPIIILIFKLKFFILWFSSSFLFLATVFTRLQTPGTQLFDVIYLHEPSLVAQMVKNLSAMQETQVWCLGREDALEKRMATHSSILAWRILWTKEPGRLWSMGLQRVGHDWATNTHILVSNLSIKPSALYSFHNYLSN